MRKRVPAVAATLVILVWLAAPANAAGVDAFDPVGAGIAEIRAAHARGASSHDIVHAYLRRIDRVDAGAAGLNSLASLSSTVLDEARALDEQREREGIRSSLHGVPIVIKDNIDVAGLPTTNGYGFLADNVPARDSFVVQRLRRAGALILGKTNMPDGARGFDTVSSYAGVTRNAYGRDSSAGGSSGGSAVAVAAGLSPVALGTDSLGSIRVPASYNGVVGLRPTPGLIGRSGVFPGSGYRNTVGLLARRAADIATVMDAIVAFDPDDAYLSYTQVACERRPDSYRQSFAENAIAGRRIGIYRVYSDDDGIDPQVKALFEQVVQELEALGAQVVPYTVPIPQIEEPPRRVVAGTYLFDLDRYLARLPASSAARSALDLIVQGAAAGQIGWAEALYLSVLRGLPMWFESFADSDAFADFRSHQGRAIAGFRQQAFSAEGAALDLLLLPTVARPVPANGIGNRVLGVVEPSLLGLPVVTLPAGFDRRGLPIAVDLLGDAFNEPLLLAVADTYQRVYAARAAMGSQALAGRAQTQTATSRH